MWKRGLSSTPVWHAAIQATCCDCCTYHCSHEHEGPCVDKRLSLDKLLNRDNELHKAAVEGLIWQVLSAEVIELHPSLASLVKQSLNTGMYSYFIHLLPQTSIGNQSKGTDFIRELLGYAGPGHI